MKLKKLLEIAKENLRDVSSLEDPDFRLEQATLQKDNETWEVVVSYLVENTNKRSSFIPVSLSEFDYHRTYKKVEIDKEGNFLGFFIYSNVE